MRFWQAIYRFLVIPLLWVALQLAGVLQSKVRRGIRGRRNLFPALEEQMRHVRAGKKVWFHSSSLGEFEQAKPIIAALKERHASIRIIVTFFSPSGYEHSRKYQLADVITYLPFDTQRGAQRFLDLVRPDVAVMVRYDVWPNHIWELARRNIPILLANATMRRQSKRRFPAIRTFHHHVYNCLNDILTVSGSDSEAFALFALKHPKVEAIGDTRYDQVLERSKEARKRHIMPQRIAEGKLVFVVGSSWPEDEAVIIPAFLELRRSIPNLLMIIVPHEPTIEHIENLEAELVGRASSIRFSALNEYRDETVIIVDSVGVLLILYGYAHIAYVGGSFRKGIHNVLEAAVFGIPVVFGPRHRNSQEPLMLVERGGGFIVNDTEELYRTLRNLLEDTLARTTAGGRAKGFVEANVGATSRFLHHLEPYLTTRAKDEVRS
jgi:3-deoxy-D-manno-octulosonic-acid transferase